MSDRKSLLNLRKSLSFIKQKEASERVTCNVKKMHAFSQNQFIAFYLAFQNEIDCSALIEHAWQQKKNVFLPILNRSELLFAPYQANSRLIQNQFGIKEPLVSPKEMIQASELDLAFVPLVGFDTQLNRIGMGLGYYDKTFAFLNNSTVKNSQDKTKPVLIGLAYEFQKLENIQPNPWDVRLDGVVTESAIYRNRLSKSG